MQLTMTSTPPSNKAAAGEGRLAKAANIATGGWRYVLACLPGADVSDK